jgi:hypothetical protein
MLSKTPLRKDPGWLSLTTLFSTEQCRLVRSIHS